MWEIFSTAYATFCLNWFQNTGPEEIPTLKPEKNHICCLVIFIMVGIGHHFNTMRHF